MRAKKAIRWECSQGELLIEQPLDERFTKVNADPSSDGLVLPDETNERGHVPACCEVGPSACRLLRLQGEDCCADCVHPR